MKTLVLDKSALMSTPLSILKRQRNSFSFLITDPLLYEICSNEERFGDNFQKVQQVGGGGWVCNQDALTWEITKGCSARHAPNQPIPSTLSDVFSKENRRWCQEFEDKLVGLMRTVHAPGVGRGGDGALCPGEQEFFHKLQEDYSLGPARNSLALEAKSTYEGIAGKRGLKVAPGFAPAPGWFSFGITLVSRAYHRWSKWKQKRGDVLPVAQKKLVNACLDQIYLSYIAIADGVLSCDEHFLKMAWACYPKKRKDLYELKELPSKRLEIVKFEPQWRPPDRRSKKRSFPSNSEADGG